MARTETYDLIERIIDLQQRLYVALRSSLAGQWMEADYTMPQLKVLLYLYTDGPSRMSSLAAALSVSLPSATGIIERLVERELVLRAQSPDDRRVVICRLSSDAERQISELWTASFDVLREMLRPLPASDLQAIASGAELMLEAAKAPSSKTPIA